MNGCMARLVIWGAIILALFVAVLLVYALATGGMEAHT